MRNELLIGYDTDELFSIDTIEDIDINITKNIYTIEDPSKRLSDFTKTVSIPGSKNNDNIFKSLFDVNFHIRDAQQLNPDFNPAKKAYCAYIQDQLTQIEGYCQLVEIVVLENNKVIYNIVIYGLNSDIFSRIGDKTLNDIEGFGTFEYTDANIIASWSDPTAVEYFPMVDNGRAFAWRQGTSVGNNSVDYESFRPWYNVRTIFYLIMDNIGIGGSQIISSFFDSLQFNSLILESDITRFVVDEAFKDDSKAEVSLTTTKTSTLSSPLQSDCYFNNVWIYNNIIQDNHSLYDSILGQWVITDAGYYSMDVTYAYIVDTFGSSGKTCDMYIMVLKSGASTPIIIAMDQKLDGAGTTYVTGTITLRSYQFNAGDAIRVCNGFAGIVIAAPGGGTTRPTSLGTTFTWNSATGPAMNANLYKDGKVSYGTTVDRAFIQYPMKQTDFVMGIVKMFNLYIQSNEDGTYVIEPRDDFYTETVVDWTTKLDVSKDFVIKPEGLLRNKEINFNYQLNDDDISSQFYQSTGQAYGYKRLIFDNDFVHDVKKLEVPFVCEPLQSNQLGMVLIKCNYNGGAEERVMRPIIAYAGGLLPCSNYAYFDYGAMTYTNYTTYPYAGFLDNPTTPTLDLCFARQDYYYHSPLKITNQGLFNVYHRNQWEQTGDRDSKLVECYIKLNALDINQLDFRKAYWIDKAAYRLLEVQDYAPNGNTTTKCIFMKLNLVDELTPETETIIGGGSGGNTGGGGTGTHTGGEGNNQTGLYNIRNGIWQGGADNVIIDSIGVVVTGIGNTVGSNCVNVIINGNNNAVAPNCQNVILINCNDLEINDSNVTYINGILYNSASGAFTLITGTSDSMSVNNSYLITNGSLVTLTLPLSVDSAITDIIKIKGYGAGFFRIAQNAGQFIELTDNGVVGTDKTTVGVTGYIQSTDANDYIEIMYVATDTWSVMNKKGTFTLN